MPQSRGLCATGLIPIAPDDTERVALLHTGGSDSGAGILRAGGPHVGPAGGEPVRPRVPRPRERRGGIARGRREGLGGEVPLPRARAILSTGPARRRGHVKAPVDMDDRRGQPVSSRLEVARHRGGTRRSRWSDTPPLDRVAALLADRHAPLATSAILTALLFIHPYDPPRDRSRRRRRPRGPGACLHD